jgi:ketosteroid isomerase-like protein
MKIVNLTVIAASAMLAVQPSRAAEASATDQLREVDKAFSVYSAEHGVAAAFRAFMDAKDGLEFDTGEPVRGADAIFKAEGGDKPPTSKLTWTTDDAFAAKSGDMGVTWGHWTDTPNDPAKKTLTGRYVTVWRKDGEGHWKGLIDIGNPD